jgi:TolA-binding protein
LRGANSGLSREENAFALLQEASRLEARGKAQEALQKYQQVVERFAATDAGRDAQKSIESLRAKTGR